ncbi:MAG: hypothetical protein OEZ41_00980 [Nitrospirota bacterium]|nr:hypothetical protein [Nitrospirota bacterium]MDH5698521.1 hypothetical protein [Nitrospirota bacterium]
MTDKSLHGKEITETQIIPDLLTGTDIGTWQAEYLLREVEFDRIKYGKPITFIWANSVALTTVGFGLNLVAKGYSTVASISTGEWVALSLGIISSIALYIIGLLLPNKRKKVMQKIENHFEKAPTIRQAFKDQN